MLACCVRIRYRGVPRFDIIMQTQCCKYKLDNQSLTETHSEDQSSCSRRSPTVIAMYCV